MKSFFIIIAILFIVNINAQDKSWQEYAQSLKENIYNNYEGMFKEPDGALKFPFITPGSDQYSNVLWDWDSWFTNIALRQIFNDLKNDKVKEKAKIYEYGSLENFFNYSGMNGWVPFRIAPNSADRTTWMEQLGNPFSTNMHKPTFAQHAAFLIKENNGDAEWIREKFYFLQSFIGAYYHHYRNRETSLHFWVDSRGIGVDNDPSTYYRPNKSSGSILLNSFMYKELLAMVYIAERLKLGEIAKTYMRDAEELKENIQKHCWDERDGFFYSVDLNLLPYEEPKIWWDLHIGGPRRWTSLIQRLDVWSGFIPLWAGIATKDQAERIVNEHFKDTTRFNSPYGIRTLSPLEKMYDVRASGNPSSWLGPIWGISNYIVFRGLVNYGYEEEAKELAIKTIKLFGKDVEKTGAMHEYYQPENGEPILNKGFQNWNYLVLNMIAWMEGRKVVSEF